MFGTRDRYPLHNALLRRNSQDFLTRLEELPKNKIEDRNASGLTLIQLAARGGNTEAVLKLLAEDAEINSAKPLSFFSTSIDLCHKPPFYLAIEHDQYLIAHVLFYLGADKEASVNLAIKANVTELAEKIQQFTMDVDIFRAVLAWIAKLVDENKKIQLMHSMQKKISVPSSSPRNKNKGDEYILLINEKEYDEKEHITISIEEEKAPDQIKYQAIQFNLSAIAELAAKNGQFKFVNYLHDHFPEVIRADRRVTCIGFWAAVHDSKMGYNLIKDNDSHIALMLTQLDEAGKQDLYEKYFQLATQTQRLQHLEISMDQQEKLNPLAARIYRAAKFSHTSSLLLYENIGNNKTPFFVEAALYAMKIKDYIALSCLFSVDSQLNLMPQILASNQRGFLLTYMFFRSQYSYEFMLNDVSSQAIFFNLLDIEQEKQGLSYRLIIQATAGITRQESEMEMRKKYFTSIGITAEQWMKMYFKIVYPQNTENVVDTIGILAGSRLELMRHQGDNFGYEIGSFINETKGTKEQKNLPRQVFFNNSKGMLTITRSYLDLKENRNLSVCSRKLFESESDDLLTKTREFQKDLREEIDSKPFYANRDYSSWRLLLGMITLFTGGSILIYYATSFDSQRYDIRDRLPYVNGTNGVPCVDMIQIDDQGEEYCPSVPSLFGPECDELCEEKDRADSMLGGLSAASAVFLLGGLACVVMLYRKRHHLSLIPSGKERFDSLPLSAFSRSLQTNAEKLFAEFKNDPTFELTVNSTAKQTRDKLEAYVKQFYKWGRSHNLFLAQPQVPVSNDDEKRLEQKRITIGVN